eukprot:TRINITY_DN31110_c0_g1_i1.p1 TRINITY_DN31110_c0_g1~~TRINITY_DN31110_c0_g1_i1.p1  ORF type:complete len:117 (-),score=22.05 TRINITY_DN31110_c0_g1_i1:152-502(-)
MRICGMVPQLAEALRKLADEDDRAGMRKVLEVVEDQTLQAGAASVHVFCGRSSLITGRDPIAEVRTTPCNPDAIVSLVVDPYNIDSKMVTQVHESTAKRQQIYQALYKFDPLAQMS